MGFLLGTRTALQNYSVNLKYAQIYSFTLVFIVKKTWILDKIIYLYQELFFNIAVTATCEMCNSSRLHRTHVDVLRDLLFGQI